ncbi:concanavalin A-like lectin/glucanase domain-containing protein, partial [Stachybotrys elegans]
MFIKSVSATVVAVAATLVSAQTSTECQPLNGTCPANSAVGRNRIDCDLTQGPCSAFFNLEGTVISYDETGAVFSINREGQAPTIESHDYIFFGRVEVELQGALGRGIVTSSVLESADLDEIDWEMVGADLQRVQSNYFGKGDLSSYDRGGFHGVADPLTTSHTYTLEWTAEKLEWIIDGVVIRTLRYEEAQGGTRYPQTPMKIKLGTWVGGGRNSPEGTVEWAGGYTDFSEAPFVARYKRISIIDYAGGSGPTTDDIREYVYGDQSGSWESIR